ncbi:hypothetical protein JCM8208_007118 [Rhodotorula glutinis]
MLRSLALPRPLLLARRSYATDALHPVTAALRAALKQSMLARTTARTGVIKSVLADLQNASHSAGSAPSPLKTLQLAISRRTDAAETFRTANRSDLADQYDDEARMLSEFMPKKPAAMSKDQLDALVRETLESNGIKKAIGKDVGRIISLVREHTGDRAEAKDVAEAVRRIELP